MSELTESVVNNPQKRRFEVTSGALVSKLDYRMGDQGRRIALVHTEVPDELAGQGIGSALVRTALTYARDEGLTVLPYCPFVASYVERHPEWQSIIGKLD